MFHGEPIVGANPAPDLYPGVLTAICPKYIHME